MDKNLTGKIQAESIYSMIKGMKMEKKRYENGGAYSIFNT